MRIPVILKNKDLGDLGGSWGIGEMGVIGGNLKDPPIVRIPVILKNKDLGDLGESG